MVETGDVYRREPKTLHELLPSVLAKVARTTKSGRVLEPLWRQAAGEVIAQKTRPIGLEGNCLWISVPSARWATELERQAETLRERLASALGEGVVDRLAFRVG